MKKVGTCLNCGREVYTNDIDLCKKCYNEVGVDFLKQINE
jgi:NMD protein affecting ribosome stability and mRNA decay